MKLQIGIEQLLSAYRASDEIFLCHFIIDQWYDWLASDIFEAGDQISEQLREFVYRELDHSGLLLEDWKGTAQSWIDTDLVDRELRVFLLEQIKLTNPSAVLTITLE